MIVNYNNLHRVQSNDCNLHGDCDRRLLEGVIRGMLTMETCLGPKGELLFLWLVIDVWLIGGEYIYNEIGHLKKSDVVLRTARLLQKDNVNMSMSEISSMYDNIRRKNNSLNSNNNDDNNSNQLKKKMTIKHVQMRRKIVVSDEEASRIDEMVIKNIQNLIIN